ncbi:MAG: monovalent cation/H(+) antiporter subunit G [Deltaproteobacteria bacterium]|nr:monovalent cation/H(+) antiporter subunit G [Deltaproteobacteria bacterium]
MLTSPAGVLVGVCLACAMVFFVAGTVGLYRFPDLHSRLHALTKADNVGLGFLVLALMIHSRSINHSLKLAFIWLLVASSSAVLCFLIACAYPVAETGSKANARD